MEFFFWKEFSFIEIWKTKLPGFPQLDLESKRRITKTGLISYSTPGNFCRLALPYSVGYSTLVIVFESVTVCSTGCSGRFISICDTTSPLGEFNVLLSLHMPMRASEHNLPLCHTLPSHNSRISPETVKLEKKFATTVASVTLYCPPVDRIRE